MRLFGKLLAVMMLVPDCHLQDAVFARQNCRQHTDIRLNGDCELTIINSNQKELFRNC